jgi:DNA-binding transcriptional MerR regulator
VHEIAKLILEHAGSQFEREEAIKKALYLGMPLFEIEAYLDWLDTIAPKKPSQASSDGDSAGSEPP